MTQSIASPVTGHAQIQQSLAINDGVFITCTPDGSGVHVTRADFLAAVAKECDVIVVDRAQLPEVSLTSTGEPWVGGLTAHDSALARDRALAFLALAEYLDAHPPVDEAQVEALADLIAQAPYRDSDYVGIAHRIIATGRVQVTL